MTKITNAALRLNITPNIRLVKLCTGILILGLALIIILPGCGKTAVEVSSAKDGDTVKVNYTLKLDDGTVLQTSVGSDPFQFTLGAGQAIPGFNDSVIGMKPGESKTVTVLAADAYGPHLDERVIEVDRSELPAAIVPEVGLHLTANNNGTASDVVIVAISDLTVTIDFNHPLAGKDLTFDIELLEIL